MEHEALTGMTSDKSVMLEDINKKYLKIYLSDKTTI